MTVLVVESLALAARTSWRLFPAVGKAPAIKGGNGLYDATSDPDGIKALFARAPAADGVAVACGLSGLVVLDLDLTPAVDGRETARNAGLPYLEDDTPRASTPRGGAHVLYRGVVPSRIGVLPGIDIKSESGYVIVPPGPGRSWEVEASPWDTEVAPAPRWLLDLAGSKRGGARMSTSEWDSLVGDAVPDGCRHLTLRSLAGHLYRRFVDPAVVRALIESFNEARCKPPQDARDLDRLLEDIAVLELRRRGGEK